MSMKTANTMILVGAIAAGALTSVAFVGATAAGSENENSTPEGVVRDLGLPVVEDPNDPSCRWGIDVGGKVYCLDAVASSQAEALSVADEIRGVPPLTDAQLAVERAQADLVEAMEAFNEADRSGDAGALDAAAGRVEEATIALQEAKAAAGL
jgi:hypothetical protein